MISVENWKRLVHQDVDQCRRSVIIKKSFKLVNKYIVHTVKLCVKFAKLLIICTDKVETQVHFFENIYFSGVLYIDCIIAQILSFYP